MKSIEIIVNETGQVSIDAIGFHGANCEKATEFLEQALGKSENKQRKPEYHVQARIRKVQQVGQ